MILGALIALAVLVGGAMWRRELPEILAIDLIQALDAAEKRGAVSAVESGFNVKDVTIDGKTLRAIFAPPYSRITWTIDAAPSGAVLETAFALRPDSWRREGDGVQFRIGVSESVYEQFVQRVVDSHRRGDRRWLSTRIDLTAYAGQTIKIIFNTDPGPANSTDMRNDLAVWGEPRILVRQGSDPAFGLREPGGLR